MRNVQLLSAVIGLAFIGGGAARAAEQPKYTLAECVRAALTNSPDLGAAAADLAAARARLLQAKAGRYGDSTYTQLFGLVNEAHGSPVYSPDNKNDFFQGLGPFTRMELEVNIPVWTFGKLDAALEAAQQGLESERARGDMRRAEVILNTKQMYSGLLLARQLSAVLHDMLDTMDKAIKKTEERLETGSSAVTEIDLLKLRIGRAKFAKGVLQVDASEGLARSALARAIGIPEGADFDIADRKLAPLEAHIDPLETYLAGGVENRPEWRQLVSGVAARSAQVKLEEAGYYPTVFFSTGIRYAVAGNRTEQTNPFAYDNFNFLQPVGVFGLRWDLNFFVQQAKVEQARAELEQVVAERRSAASGLLLDIRRAYSEVAQQRATMGTAEQGRKAARALLILSVSNFDLGIGEAEELFKALGAYTEASSDYFRAVHDYNLALAMLSKAVGKEVTNLAYE